MVELTEREIDELYEAQVRNTKGQTSAWIIHDETFTNQVENEDDDCEPETKHDPWGRYGKYQLVGNGEVTNPENAEGTNPKACGRFYGFNGCVHTELHDVTTLDGLNHKGMAFVSKRFRYCDKPTCPICYSHWAWVQSNSITIILAEASKKQGKIEHIIVGVPQVHYSLSFEEMRKKAQKALDARGIKGGGLIFHAFRYRKHNKTVGGILYPRGWYWSCHWHVIGFLVDGYGKCRNCSNCRFDAKGSAHVKSTAKCLACDGFEGCTRRKFEKEGGKGGAGYIVKVKGERKTVQGTAWYQLNHCSVRTDGKHHAIMWFGTCNRNKLKLTKERIRGLREKAKCPICGSELVALRYMGFDGVAISREFWIKQFEEPAFDKEGLPVWVEKT